MEHVALHALGQLGFVDALTLGLVLDGSGFVRRSKTFAGNVSEGLTLQGMLTDLQASPGAMVIQTAGGQTVRLEKVKSEDAKEVLLY